MARHTAKSHKIRKVEILVIQISIYRITGWRTIREDKRITGEIMEIPVAQLIRDSHIWVIMGRRI